MKQQITKLSKYSLTVLFIIIIFSVPILTKLKPHRSISTFENRALATLPACNKDTLLSGEYFNSWEDYLSDHIIGRNTWLKIYTNLNMNILKKHKINDIVIGREGTLLPFYSYCSRYDLDKHRSDIKELVENLKDLNDYVDDHGGKFCFVGVPAQQSYYIERYPKYFNNNKQYFINSEKLMFSFLEENDINFINMAEEFRKLDRKDYYFKTDHHYNFKGAFKTYQKIIDTLKFDLGLDIQKALDESDMDIITLKGPILGSRNRQLYYLYPTDEKLQIAYSKEKIDYKKWDNGKESPEFYHIPSDKRPSYNVFMGGDVAETVITTNRTNLPNALIFGDSFTNALEPLLYYHFNETRILDLRYYKKMNLYDYIEKYKPDIVIMVRDDAHYDKISGNSDFRSS